MRRLILLLVLAFSPAVYPFGMTVENHGFVNLGNLAPGQSEYDGGFNYSNNTIVSLNVTPALPFTLAVEADGFRGPTSMPISALSWQLSYAHAAISLAPWVTALPSAYVTRAFSAPSVKDTVYSYAAVPNETGIYQFNFLWHILVPNNQQAGSYYTNIWFTLTQ